MNADAEPPFPKAKESDGYPEQPWSHKSSTYVGSYAGDTEIMTVSHDGHLFVIWKDSILHHPGCDCKT